MYTFDGRVRYSETDEYGKLSLTGVMNYLQDCSTFQSEDNGLGLSYFIERNRAWLLSSWQIIIDRYPALGENIRISTWPYEMKGFYGYRNFTIRDQNDEYLVRANSVWFLFDTEKGRPVKIEPEDIKGYGDHWEDPLDMETASRKILLPKNYIEAAPVKVGKHFIDTNHHVNNAKYVEIARELLPDEEDIHELRVEYKKAAVLGDVICPRITYAEDGTTVSLCDQQGSAYAAVWLRKTTERM